MTTSKTQNPNGVPPDVRPASLAESDEIRILSFKMPFGFGLWIFLALLSFPTTVHAKRSAGPVVEETEQGKVLVLPEAVQAQIDSEFPGAHVLQESEFDPEMLRYFHTNIIGLHPAVAWGDFNGDRKTDYALLLMTGQTPWGPLVEMVIFNGRKKNRFDTFHIGEVYGHKTDYLRFHDGNLYKGKFHKGGWYINWDKKNKTYVVKKS